MKTSIFLVFLAMLSTSVFAQNEIQIELNNGERWEVSSESNASIKAMENAIGNYKGNDPVGLQQQLSEEFMNLFNQSSKEGEGHSQLRQYLYPLRGKLAPLLTCEEEACDEQVELISDHLSIYHTYFK